MWFQSLDLDENMIIENQNTAYAFYICLAGIPLLIVWAVNGLTIWEIIGEYNRFRLKNGSNIGIIWILDCCSKCNRHHESRRPSAFGHEKSTNQTFEMRIAKTFLAMTSGNFHSLAPPIVANQWVDKHFSIYIRVVSVSLGSDNWNHYGYQWFNRSCLQQLRSWKYKIPGFFWFRWSNLYFGKFIPQLYYLYRPQSPVQGKSTLQTYNQSVQRQTLFSEIWVSWHHHVDLFVR